MTKEIQKFPLLHGRKKVAYEAIAAISLSVAAACARSADQGRDIETNPPVTQPPVVRKVTPPPSTGVSIDETKSTPFTQQQVVKPTFASESEVKTATPDIRLTDDEMRKIKSSVYELIKMGLAETPIDPLELNRNPKASNDYLNLYFISNKIELCDLSKYGQSFDMIGADRMISPSEMIYSVRRTVLPTDFDYTGMFLSNCESVANATKVLYQASNNEKFQLANELWKPFHKQLSDEVLKRDANFPRNYWLIIESVYYIDTKPYAK